MFVGFVRHSLENSFRVFKDNKTFVLVMAADSLVGAWIGGMLLPYVPSGALLPLLAVILLVSAMKVWRHR